MLRGTWQKKMVKFTVIQIREVSKERYCSRNCLVKQKTECIINVWGYTEILPNLPGNCSRFLPSVHGKIEELVNLFEQWMVPRLSQCWYLSGLGWYCCLDLDWKMPWKLFMVLLDVIPCNLERLVEEEELDQCTGRTATHEEIHNSLLRTKRLERSHLL